LALIRCPELRCRKESMHHDVAMRHAPILSVNVTGTCRSVLSVNWSDRYGAHTPVVTGSGQWIPSHLFWRVSVLGDSAALDYAVLGHSNMTFHTECPPSCRCPTQQRTSAQGSFVLLRFVGSLLQGEPLSGEGGNSPISH
jgi:hypothetical protein